MPSVSGEYEGRRPLYDFLADVERKNRIWDFKDQFGPAWRSSNLTTWGFAFPW
jgi:hypothetical protein